MTNTLIPYSFIPGTKAKASEVNANFIALADELQNVNTTLSEEISDNFGAIAEKCAFDVLLDNRTLSYCIISAPNEVMSYLGGILTVPSGLKILTPNGKNSDDSLKSVEYTLSEAVTIDMTSYSNGTRYLWLEDGGGYFFTDISSYYTGETAPSSANIVWYNPKTNELKKYSSENSGWVSKKAVLLGKITTSSGSVTKITPKAPLHILTRSDLAELSCAGLPSSGTDLSVLGTGGQYTMPDDGYFMVTGTFSNSGYLQLYDTTSGIALSASGNAYFPAGVMIPVKKGNSVYIYYYNLSVSTVKFYYTEGNK